MPDESIIAKQSASLRRKLSDLNSSATVCVASKYANIDHIRCLYEQGFRVFGENKVQDALTKIEGLKDLPDISWHFIGHLQRNKVRKILPHVDVIQSVDSFPLLEKINSVSVELNRQTKCYLQINIGKENNKTGFLPENFIENKSKFFSFSNIQVQGIMVVAPKLDDKNELKLLFNHAIELFQEMFENTETCQLSMGMSQDFDLAIESGASMVRIGRMLFQD